MEISELSSCKFLCVFLFVWGFFGVKCDFRSESGNGGNRAAKIGLLLLGFLTFFVEIVWKSRLQQNIILV